MTYYFDIDGVLANFHKEPYKYINAINRTWIANLNPFAKNVQLVRDLINAGEKVYILSKAASEEAKLGKIDWLARYIPELVIENIIVIVKSGRKIDFVREDGILIDDDVKNTRQWEKAGLPVYLLENKGAEIAL